jgi:hypothetical protein
MTSEDRNASGDAATNPETPVTRLRRYEVHVRLRLRVIAEDEEQAARTVAEDVAAPIVETVQELHATNARLAGWSLHADDVVEELEA